MSDKLDLTVFVDSVGRTVLGEVVEQSKQVLTVKNPAIVHVQPNAQTGQISVQLIPFFFKEFLKDPQGGTTSWDFLKENITLANDIDLDERLLTQYKNMYSVIQTPGGASGSIDTPGADAPVIKLFDD
tara:strand:- start:734 stop:1117 length:384 start_codon:yes stop_codon:yes gene_type:complete